MPLVIGVEYTILVGADARTDADDAFVTLVLLLTDTGAFNNGPFNNFGNAFFDLLAT